MTGLMMPWSAPLNILGSLHTGDAFINTYRFVAAWVSDHGRTPSDAKLQDVIDLRDLLKKEPQRLTELHTPAVLLAVHMGRLEAVLALFLPQLDEVIKAVPKVPLERFVTACSVEMGSQLWMIMQCVDELGTRGVNAVDDLQMLRESMFGVVNRCCGKKPAVQLRLLVEYLNDGMRHLERLSGMLKDAYAVEQKARPDLPSVSDEQAVEILSQLGGNHHA